MENHFIPLRDTIKRFVFFVKIKTAANIQVDTEPNISVAKNGLGMSENPTLSIG